MANIYSMHNLSVNIKFKVGLLGVCSPIAISRLSLSASYEHRRIQNYILAMSLGLVFAHWISLYTLNDL